MRFNRRNRHILCRFKHFVFDAFEGVEPGVGGEDQVRVTDS